jgi:hypothetical protein
MASKASIDEGVLEGLRTLLLLEKEEMKKRQLYIIAWPLYDA